MFIDVLLAKIKIRFPTYKYWQQNNRLGMEQEKKPCFKDNLAVSTQSTPEIFMGSHGTALLSSTINVRQVSN
jgi:hypothetical protein